MHMLFYGKINWYIMVILRQVSKIRIEHFFIAICVIALGFFMIVKDPRRANAVTDIFACGTINTSGNYRLVDNISAGGTCLTIAGNNVVIDGNGFGITGNIDGSSNDPTVAAYTFSVTNININGSIYANGAPGDASHPGGTGGSITLINVTANAVEAKGGAGYTGQQGAEASLGENATAGGNGGTIDITTSNVATVNASGGDGGVGGQGGSGIQMSAAFGGTGGPGGNGGTGGTIQFTQSTSTESLYAVGGNGGRGGDGGVGYTGLDGANGNLSGGSPGTFGGQGGVGGSGAVSGMGGLITISNRSYIASGAYVYGGDGGRGGQGGAGGPGGAGGNADLDYSAGGDGGQGGQGGKGGDGAYGSEGGTINVYESTVSSIGAYGGAPGPYGSGGAGGVGGNGGNQFLTNGQGGNGGTGGTGGNTGDSFGNPTEHGGVVNLRDAKVDNVSHFGGQPPSAGTAGTGGAGGQGGVGPTPGNEGVAGVAGSEVGTSGTIGGDGTLSLEDNSPYSIVLNGAGTTTITQGTTFSDPGAYGLDLKDGRITATVSGSVDINTVGTYILTYTVTDLGSAPIVNGSTIPEYTINPHSTSTTRTVLVVAAAVGGNGGQNNTPTNSGFAQQSAIGGVTAYGTGMGGGPNMGVENNVQKNQNNPNNQNQNNINNAGAIKSEIRQKIDAVFGEGKGALEIIALLGKQDVQQLVKKELDIESIEPFQKSLKDNLKKINSSECPAFTKNIFPGKKDNDPEEVKKWQRFYNTLFGTHLEINGIYNNATVAETFRFQKVFTSIVLSPWGVTDPTGNIMITTRFAANGILGCPLEARK